MHGMDARNELRHRRQTRAVIVIQNLCLKICKHILIWIEEQTYWIVLRFLVLGFELELYSTSEYCMVYRYIYVIQIKLVEKIHIKMMLGNDSSRQKSKKEERSCEGCGQRASDPSCGSVTSVIYLCCRKSYDGNYPLLLNVRSSLVLMSGGVRQLQQDWTYKEGAREIGAPYAAKNKIGEVSRRIKLEITTRK